jgi:hypothetical protein
MKKIIEKLDKLIEEGNDILKEEYDVTDTGWHLDEPVVSGELFTPWELKTISFLENNIGSSNLYVKSFQEGIDTYSSSIRTGIGLLNAIKDEIQDGSLVIESETNTLESINNTYNGGINLNFPENKGLKVFISYSTKNKKYGQKIKDFFTNIDVDSFLAENDIEASEEWRERIFNELISSNIFIFVLSEEFKDSNWCGQEAGMAFLKRKLHQGLIFPIIIDNTRPYGFFDIFQAIPYSEDALNSILTIIDKEYSTNLSEKMESSPGKIIVEEIEELLKANSYIDASKALYVLSENVEFITTNQANKIFEYSSINNQVYGCYKCEKHLKIISNKFKNKINPKYLKKLGIK